MNKKYYIEAFNELEKTFKNNSRDFKKINRLINICIEGQDLGIKELQKVES